MAKALLVKSVSKQVEVAPGGFSAAPSECALVEFRLRHSVEAFSCEAGDSVLAEEGKGRDFWLFIVRTGALTEVAPPYRVKFSHHFDLFLGELALSLRDGGKTVCTLAAENPRRASAAACAAGNTVLMWVRDATLPELFCRNIGNDVGDKNVGAVLLVNEKSRVTENAESCRKCRVTLVDGAVVAVALGRRVGEKPMKLLDKLCGIVPDSEVIISGGGVTREILALACVIGQKEEDDASRLEALALHDRGIDLARQGVIEDAVILYSLLFEKFRKHIDHSSSPFAFSTILTQNLLLCNIFLDFNLYMLYNRA